MDIVAIILATLYLLITILITLQVVMIIRSNDKIVTIRTGILMILCLSCLFRSIFWIKESITISISTWIMLILYFLPVWGNVFGISLLTVFYFETWISAAKSSKPIKLMLTPIQICLTLNFIFFIIAVSIITVISQKSNYSNVMTSIYEGYASFLDLFLALSLFILGYNFYTDFLRKGTKVLLPKNITTFYIINCLVTLTYFVRYSNNHLLIIVIIIIIIITRGIFSLIIALQIQLPFDVSVDFSEYHEPTTSTALIFYLFLEWFPISCIVFLLWRRIYFKTNPNESIEKLLLSSTSIDDESQISINYNEVSDAEAINLYVSSYNLVGSSSYISSYNLVGTDNDEYDSVIYPTNNDNAAHANEDDNNIVDNSPVSERSSQTRGSRTTYVGNTPPPKHFNNSAPKPAALDFIFRKTSPFAITSSDSRESSPSLQISPASNSSLSAYDSLLSKYQPPKLGQSTLSHLHMGAPFVNERDPSKVLNSYTSRDSLNSNTDQDF